MNDRILTDAYNLKKLIREAEALADESIIAMARLKHLKENPNAFYEAIQELQNVAARRQQAGMGMSGRPRRRPAPPPASREITPAQGFY